jgi:hypothetical protein
MSNNIHSASIPANTLQQALARANEIKTLLAPYLSTLTPDQRHDLPKMGDKTWSFVDKAHELAVVNPVLVPPFVVMNDYNIDYADAHGILPLLVTVQQLSQGISDTRLLAGSEAYQASLAFYNSAKQAAKQNVPGAKAVYEALKTRFPGTTRHVEEKGEL